MGTTVPSSNNNREMIMSKETPNFDAFLKESTDLREAARAQLLETAGEQQALTESTNSQEEAVAALEAATGKKGKVMNTGNLGGGVKSFTYKVKLNDKEATAAAKELQNQNIYISNMATLGQVMVSYLSK